MSVRLLFRTLALAAIEQSDHGNQVLAGPSLFTTQIGPPLRPVLRSTGDRHVSGRPDLEVGERLHGDGVGEGRFAVGVGAKVGMGLEVGEHLAHARGLRGLSIPVLGWYLLEGNVVALAAEHGDDVIPTATPDVGRLPMRGVRLGRQTWPGAPLIGYSGSMPYVFALFQDLPPLTRSAVSHRPVGMRLNPFLQPLQRPCGRPGRCPLPTRKIASKGALDLST